MNNVQTQTVTAMKVISASFVASLTAIFGVYFLLV